MSGELEKLKQVEERNKRKVVDLDERQERIRKIGGEFAIPDLDDKLRLMADDKDRPKSMIDSITRGLFWGNKYIWDRSYVSNYDFSISQRSKIINYGYDRFTSRAARVSKAVQNFDPRNHQEMVKSHDVKELREYLEEIDLIREHNQYIATNELWNCQARIKYASMLWGFLMTSAISVVVFRKFSTPKKAAIFYGTTFLSMFYAKVAFSERVIDVFYPFLRFDIEKRFKSQEESKALTDELMSLGKSKPLNRRVLAQEKKIHEQRLSELKEQKGLLAPRLDDVDGEREARELEEKVVRKYEETHKTKLPRA